MDLEVDGLSTIRELDRGKTFERLLDDLKRSFDGHTGHRFVWGIVAANLPAVRPLTDEIALAA